MNKHKVEIQLGPAGTGTVRLDGQEIQGVRAVDVSGEVHEIPVVRLDLLVFDVVLDGEAIVELPPATVETLTRLGWAPPAEDALDAKS